MAYYFSRGTINTTWQKMMPEVGIILPLLAIFVFMAAALTSATYSGGGRSPYIQPPTKPASKPNPAASQPKAATSQSAPAASTPAYSNSAGVNQATMAAPPTPATSQPSGGTLSGGMGGGSLSSPTTSSTTAPTTTTTAPSSLQTTVTIPSVNLQAGDKTLLNTSSTSVTVN